MTRALVVVAIALVSALAQAAPRKVFVLPVDGNADPALRKTLDAQVQKLAHQIAGTVTTGDATFADTAAMVGCDPAQPACTDTVLATLSADELVWGTATTTNGQTTFVVRRAIKGNMREQVAMVDAQNAEAVGGQLQPLFGGTATGSESGSGSAAASGSGSAAASATGTATATGGDATVGWSQEKKLGIGFAAAGGAALIVGLALWANESSLQGQINSTPLPQTSADVQSLLAIENRAQSYANWGNGIVLLGLVAGGVGAYYLWKDHEAATVTPVPATSGTGATLVIGGKW
jgi:hypothetical protein